MSFLRFFRRKREDEASRYTRLAKTGRITDGSVVDVKSDDSNRITHVFYSYIIAGVEYECSQELTAEQKAREDGYSAGTNITIRYDPRQPANSIVV